MYENHPYTINGVCPCRIGEDAVKYARLLYRQANDMSAFVEAMELVKVIGKKVWYNAGKNTIYITKKYACECGGGCASNKTIIGERCHCDHYNHTKEFCPKHYCKCGAEFYRPMFAPFLGDNVLIEPYKTVLSGDDECIIAVSIGEVEQI